MNVTHLAHDQNFILARAREGYFIVRVRQEQVLGPLDGRTFKRQRQRLGVLRPLTLEPLRPLH
ncbi:hypothetical protein [Deinococcus apachensis]|uniref:hypothetical protein n=1 Tax=Deinococcus apachensis TaxID=309886 RepID=UPI000374026A|nr:hypothetical protein [Deinococcus apachensis]